MELNQEKRVFVNPNFMDYAKSHPMQASAEKIRERNVQGLGFPFKLTIEEFDFIRKEAARGVSNAALCRLFFGKADPREYMRIKKVIEADKYELPTSDRKPFLTKRSKDGGRNLFPYGLSDADLSNIYHAYANGSGVKRLARMAFRKDDGRFQARIRKIIDMGASAGVIVKRDISGAAIEAGRLGGIARAAKYRTLADNSVSRPTATKTAPVKTLSPVEVSGEAKVFAELSNVYMQRLRRAVRGDNQSDIAATFNDLRSALQELASALPKSSKGIQDIV